MKEIGFNFIFIIISITITIMLDKISYNKNTSEMGLEPTTLRLEV